MTTAQIFRIAQDRSASPRIARDRWGSFGIIQDGGSLARVRPSVARSQETKGLASLRGLGFASPERAFEAAQQRNKEPEKRLEQTGEACGVGLPPGWGLYHLNVPRQQRNKELENDWSRQGNMSPTVACEQRNNELEKQDWSRQEDMSPTLRLLDDTLSRTCAY